MTTLPIITILLALPLLGAAGLWLVPSKDARAAQYNAKRVALWVSILTFFFSLILWAGFSAHETGYQFVEHHLWLPEWGLTYYVGIDGLSLFLVVLSTLLVPICILSSWRVIEERVKLYMALFLILETFMIGAFVSLNMILFYVFFEGVLVPMYFLIGIWGGTERLYAAFKFFLYTFLGSLIMLLGMLLLYFVTGTFDVPQLAKISLDPMVQNILWWAFFASFAVKMPMWPFHTWLPDAHVQAPTAASVILAGVLLKMGGYGFMRFSIPLFPEASHAFADVIYWLSVIAVVYTSLIALVQKDMKKLIAYSSVAHMGFVTLGLFTLTLEGMTGGIFQMLSHGVISGALFLCVGVLYDRLHTKEIAAYGGVVKVMPVFATIFMVFTLATIGVPGTSGFIGEMLVIVGGYKVSGWIVAGVALGLVLGAAYSLYLYRRVVFGSIVNKSVSAMKDLSVRELCLFAPLIVLVLWMGIAPNSFLAPIEQYVHANVTAHSFPKGGTV